jgi:dihydrofolate reductase
MKISLISAMSQNRAIGIKGRLPWQHVPADWHNLEIVTAGKKMIMGRKSYDTPDRIGSKTGNIVVTRQLDYQVDEGFEVADSLEAALTKYADQDEVFVIGGQQIFEQIMPLAQTIHLTVIHDEFEGDAFFPVFDESLFDCTEQRFEADAQNPYDYSFLIFERK